MTPDGGTIEILGGDDAPVAADCPEVRCFSGQVFHACACVTPPRDAAATVRTTCGEIATAGVTRTPESDFCSDGPADQAPDLGCFGAGRRAPLTRERPVTVYGVVDVFANGADSDAITVEIYREGADGQLGAMVGTATASIASPCVETEIEIENGEPTGESRQLGYYTIPEVPSEVPLIIVTRGDVGLWKPLYTYNIVVLDEEIETGAPAAGACADTPTAERFEYRARVLSVADYRTIPRTTGLSGGIPAGHGAIAGEVHDCTNTRLELAQVGLRPTAEALTYFTNDADNPVPDVNRDNDGTSLLGLYAGLDLLPGPIDVSAVGRVDGELVSLGWYRARIFADSVTSVSLRGLRPHQTAP